MSAFLNVSKFGVRAGKFHGTVERSAYLAATEALKQTGQADSNEPDLLMVCQTALSPIPQRWNLRGVAAGDGKIPTIWGSEATEITMAQYHDEQALRGIEAVSISARPERGLRYMLARMIGKPALLDMTIGFEPNPS